MKEVGDKGQTTPGRHFNGFYKLSIYEQVIQFIGPVRCQYVVGAVEGDAREAVRYKWKNYFNMRISILYHDNAADII